MGCDIHEHIEIKIDGEWVFIGGIYIGRDYSLFGVLAGVRDEEVECVSKGGHKGLPDDLSQGMIELMEGDTDWEAGQWHADNHSHSYLNLDELKLAKKVYKIYMKKIKYTRVFPINIKALEKLKEMPFVTDVRFVFWFDN